MVLADVASIKINVYTENKKKKTVIHNNIENMFLKSLWDYFWEIFSLLFSTLYEKQFTLHCCKMSLMRIEPLIASAAVTTHGLNHTGVLVQLCNNYDCADAQLQRCLEREKHHLQIKKKNRQMFSSEAQTVDVSFHLSSQNSLEFWWKSASSSKQVYVDKCRTSLLSSFSLYPCIYCFTLLFQTSRVYNHRRVSAAARSKWKDHLNCYN